MQFSRKGFQVAEAGLSSFSASPNFACHESYGHRGQQRLHNEAPRSSQKRRWPPDPGGSGILAIHINDFEMFRARLHGAADLSREGPAEDRILALSTLVTPEQPFPVPGFVDFGMDSHDDALCKREPSWARLRLHFS